MPIIRVTVPETWTEADLPVDWSVVPDQSPRYYLVNSSGTTAATSNSFHQALSPQTTATMSSSFHQGLSPQNGTGLGIINAQMIYWAGNMTFPPPPEMPAPPGWEPTAPHIIRNREKVAARRARKLLLTFLTEEQKAEFIRDGTVTFDGRLARYRLNFGRSGNIDVLPLAPADGADARPTHTLCIHPPLAYSMPVEDTLIAQLLRLRDDEDEVRRIANWSRHGAVPDIPRMGG